MNNLCDLLLFWFRTANSTSQKSRTRSALQDRGSRSLMLRSASHIVNDEQTPIKLLWFNCSANYCKGLGRRRWRRRGWRVKSVWELQEENRARDVKHYETCKTMIRLKSLWVSSCCCYRSRRAWHVPHHLISILHFGTSTLELKLEVGGRKI